MPVPNIDFEIMGINVLPPNYRKPTFILFLKALLNGIVREYGIFKLYINGSNYSAWSGAVTYGLGERLQDLFGVYESITDGNIGNPVTDKNNWLKILDSFIGAKERSRYNSRKLTLEWALNRYFKQQLSDCGFIGYRNPGDMASPLISDIYTDNVANVSVSFAVDNVSQSLGEISTNTLPHGIANDTILGIATTYKFIIHIPAAVYADINSNPIIAETIVRAFVDQYNVSGVTYSIQTY